MQRQDGQGFGRLPLPAGGVEIGVSLLRPPQLQGGRGGIVPDGIDRFGIPDRPGDLFGGRVVGRYLRVVRKAAVAVAGKSRASSMIRTLPSAAPIWKADCSSSTARV